MRFLLAVALIFCATFAGAQNVKLFRQHNMGKWGVPAGNYSGITWIGGDRYALVSDKQKADGWQEVRITFNGKGDIADVKYIGTHYDESGTLNKARDAEGIVYVPTTNTLFIAAESDQQVLEVDSTGKATGRKLDVPAEMDVKHIRGNYGFEALAYDTLRHRFWTMPENTLKADGQEAGYGKGTCANLRLLAFDDSLHCCGQWMYRTDNVTVSKRPKHYAFGVTEMTAMDDGSLLVLEREFYVAKKYVGSWVVNKVYRIDPLHDKGDVLGKRLMAKFKTRLNLTRRNLANYEGMCLGPKLENGSLLLVMVSDSQDNYGNKLFRMKDYIKVVLLKK